MSVFEFVTTIDEVSCVKCEKLEIFLCGWLICWV